MFWKFRKWKVRIGSYCTTGCLFRLGIFHPLSTGYNTCSMMARLDLFYSKHLSFCDFRIKSTEISSKWQNFVLYIDIFPHFSPIAKYGAKARALGYTGSDFTANCSFLNYKMQNFYIILIGYEVKQLWRIYGNCSVAK